MLPPPPEAELDGEADEKALEAYMSASLQWWETSIAEVRARLHARDDEMRQTYAKRVARVVTDLREPRGGVCPDPDQVGTKVEGPLVGAAPSG